VEKTKSTFDLSPDEREEWNEIIRAAIKAQELVDGSILVGGTASALYAGHRVSRDADNILATLRDHFDEVLESLAASPDWALARVRRPVLILGSIGDVEVGFRQSKRISPVETRAIKTDYGNLTVPTLDEMIGMKAYLAYVRNATRDYLDFAALAKCVTAAEALNALLKLDRRYGDRQTASVGLEIAKVLVEAEPFDLEDADLANYKSLAPEWQKWGKIKEICRYFGNLLGEKLVFEK